MSSETITRNDLTNILNEVLPPNGTWEEITITNTMTTGTGGTVKAYRCNNMLMLTFTEIYKNATTNAGFNLYESTITGLPSTTDFFSSVTFSGARAIVFQVSRSGSSATFTARVLADNLPDNIKVSGSCITAIIGS